LKSRTPLLDALLKYDDDKVILFDVPGHKHGNGNKELADVFGEKLLRLDVNSMKRLDYINNPVSVIEESQKLLAELYGGEDSFFLVNGTSAGVQAMIMSICNPGDKIIMPRNAHKSAINALILSGAEPIYINPEYNSEIGIHYGVTFNDIHDAIAENPDVKAVFIINPSYFGVASDLKKIVDLCHMKNIAVLVDEAHGAHLKFSKGFPVSAMEAGADITAVSLHKTGGSLTQSSAIVMKSKIISKNDVREAINLSQTTSASYILMASLDVARKNIEERGHKTFNSILNLSKYCRDEINKIEGFSVIGRELINENSFYDFDETKLVISAKDLGMSGFELYDVLRDDYNIQMELGDTFVALAIISVGDDENSVNAIIEAVKDISLKKAVKDIKIPLMELPTPSKLKMCPREAYFAKKKVVSIKESIGKIAGESIMVYPPGIPIVSLGEEITEEIIEYIAYIKGENASFANSYDKTLKHVKVIMD